MKEVARNTTEEINRTQHIGLNVDLKVVSRNLIQSRYVPTEEIILQESIIDCTKF